MGVSLLLDTHALLWAVAESHKLSETARHALELPANALLVSSVSLFEVATKVRLGKLPTPGDLLTRWEWSLARLSARLLPLTGSAAILAGEWTVPHRDPFDRLLAAQAQETGAALVTCDPAFGQFPALRLVW